MTNLPTPPELGTTLPAANGSKELLQMLAHRRSTTAAMMAEPGPDAAELSDILQVASRVPDHRRVTPYRFILIEGDDRARFGDILAEACRTTYPAMSDDQIDVERGRFLRAPVVVAVVFSPDLEHKTPAWEQVLSTGAVCMNMLLAANATGFAAQWLTEWYAYDENVLTALGVKKPEQVSGFIYIGSAKEDPKERPRVDASTLTTKWRSSSV